MLKPDEVEYFVNTTRISLLLYKRIMKMQSCTIWRKDSKGDLHIKHTKLLWYILRNRDKKFYQKKLIKWKYLINAMPTNSPQNVQLVKFENESFSIYFTVFRQVFYYFQTNVYEIREKGNYYLSTQVEN